MLYFADVTPMNSRKRIIFLIAFAVPVINLIIFGFIYHLPDAFPVAGLLALILGVIYIRLLNVRGPIEASRRRLIRISIRLYIGPALVALLNIIGEGWHWYDILYPVFPTAASALLFWSNREKLKKESAQ